MARKVSLLARIDLIDDIGIIWYAPLRLQTASNSSANHGARIRQTLPF